MPSGTCAIPDPWRVLARTDLLVVRLPIPEAGRYYHEERTIVLRKGLLLVEERAALWHELVHARRGDEVQAWPLGARVEASVDREAARRAMPLASLLEATSGDPSRAEVADRLKTTEHLLGVRLAALHPAERGALAQQAATREWVA